MEKEQDKYWLNTVLDTVEEKYPSGDILVSSGISPSASYHIGNFREIMSADLIKVGLELRGRKVKHIHIVDNFDPLRKKYSFLPDEYENYVGWPVCLVPSLDKKYASYADQFFDIFYQTVKELKIDAEVIKSYEELYCTGRMTEQIEMAVDHVNEIKTIFKEVSNRELGDDYIPLQILSDKNKFNEWTYKSIDKNSKEVIAIDDDGNEHRAAYDKGQVKLPWRLDWPARWGVLGVMVEPHGFQEHGASGGSYQTGLRFAKEVFGIEGPIAGIQYGHIHLPGDNIKMSSSLNNLVTPDEALKIMPPAMLRYFYARYPGKKRVEFDPGMGFYRLMDEFSQVDVDAKAGNDNEFLSAYKIATAVTESTGMSTLPFSQIVNVYQAALKNKEDALKILERTCPDEAGSQKQAILNEFDFAKNWLEKWAPDEVKFDLKQELPNVEISQLQKQMLGQLAQQIKESDGEKDGPWFHALIHEVREKNNLAPGEAFQAVYRVLLGKDSGPKAGWFLSILDKEFLINRFNEASK